MMDVAITIGALTMSSLLPKRLGVILTYDYNQKMTPTLFWQRTNLEQIWQFRPKKNSVASNKQRKLLKILVGTAGLPLQTLLCESWRVGSLQANWAG